MNFRGDEMSTFRFGTSVGPARIVGNAQEVREEDEDKPVDDADPNVVMQCPYDPNHHIRACRFPFHVLKCAKNHPKLAKELKTCPFNAKHMVPRHELARHIEHCEDKPSLTTEDDGNTKMHPKFHVPVKCTSLPCEEDWEKEADDNAATFVWGVTNHQLIVNNPPPPVTNDLKAGIRAPQTLPWKF
ncbi:gametocyte-specific factor 1 isoform X2 [Ictalurus punctatus]|nr:gametocyte-specific factor 1 isoform X2 [Ictalurus punctatus]XP_017342923.1 gametocyte-specific factor 1 isoform X2 [Ictalurus punctatus]XP_017342926.1 gametocyte-specific factor 1 isoform X2 [Ictalurus punctatus]XP_017342927.1 gametocyte-specific factor 1 isoform X2 [Ictalurus punctatus]XP_053542168.1 gametocyte-specific factor 1 isoform X2 [Ictalurus punctatus]